MMRGQTRFSPSAITLAVLLLATCIGNPFVQAEDTEKPLEPCTIISPATQSFFDLTSISKHPPTDKDREKHKNEPDWTVKSWHARGHDYGANFTINFCAPVLENFTTVEGVDKTLWNNISAFYEMSGKTYSIGQMNARPVFRGRKLILNYTDGSPCPSNPSSRARARRSVDLLPRQLSAPTEHDYDLHSHEAEDVGSAENVSDEDSSIYESADFEHKGREHGYDLQDSASGEAVRRKSTIFSLFCERDPLAAKAAVSFVGTMDECTYFFEVRTYAACPTTTTQTQSLGPSGVFGVIALIAVIVYVVGGCVYQRTVMHQRGWRQMPNYNLWSGIFNGLSDCFIIATSSCARCLPYRRGYNRVASGGYGRGGRQAGHNDDENRLIDQLDEEWDD